MRYRFAVALAVAVVLIMPAVGARADEQDEASPATKQDATSAADSEQERPDEGEPDEGETDEPEGSPRQLLQRMFDDSSPPLGSPLPDITAFDADGHEINLGSLKGHWSVIVFGCLT
jgi:cytochrome oxidase Cu insertion factor (SCO1/SenC/PrrC family)